ncbi:MAG: sigma-70 family RNA polymerase sigma factor [Myxococcales bacterium]|nr:sigma-70 family RNA polymerase sigma factor [Myxococcales bacterium]
MPEKITTTAALVQRQRLTSTSAAARQRDYIFVTRLLANDAAAWRVLWHDYQGPLRRHIRATVGALWDDANDELIADIFVMLCDDDFRRLRHYDPARAAFATYLAAIARNAARDSQRRRRARISLRGCDDASALPPTDSCHDVVAGRQELRRLRGCLSQGEAQVIESLLVADGDSELVAVTLGLDLAAVYSRKHKAIRKMQRAASAVSQML